MEKDKMKIPTKFIPTHVLKYIVEDECMKRHCTDGNIYHIVMQVTLPYDENIYISERDFMVHGLDSFWSDKNFGNKIKVFQLPSWIFKDGYIG